MAVYIADAKGEPISAPLTVGFDRRVKLQFRGASPSSDGGRWIHISSAPLYTGGAMGKIYRRLVLDENRKLEQTRPICHHHSIKQSHLGDIG